MAWTRPRERRIEEWCPPVLKRPACPRVANHSNFDSKSDSWASGKTYHVSWQWRRSPHGRRTPRGLTNPETLASIGIHTSEAHDGWILSQFLLYTVHHHASTGILHEKGLALSGFLKTVNNLLCSEQQQALRARWWRAPSASRATPRARSKVQSCRCPCGSFQCLSVS